MSNLSACCKQLARLLFFSLQVAASYVNLGGLLKALGRQREALPYFMKALDIRERAFGPEHPDVSGAQLCLAELLKDLGRWGASCKWLSRALHGNSVLTAQDLGAICMAAQCLTDLMLE